MQHDLWNFTKLHKFGVIMNTIGQRLKQLRMYLGLNPEQIADNLAISVRSYTSYEYDERKPSVETFFNLYTVFDVNLNWLITGQGEMCVNFCDNSHFFVNNNAPVKNFKNWGKRLNEVLAENEETPYNFAKRTGISEARIEKFILDSAEPTLSELNKIKANVAISVDWLLYGEYKEHEAQTENAALSSDEILQIKKLLKNSSI